MSGPWEKYQTSASGDGPWTKYQAPATTQDQAAPDSSMKDVAMEALKAPFTQPYQATKYMAQNPEKLPNALPMAGMTIGGMAGGLGAPIGAGLGTIGQRMGNIAFGNEPGPAERNFSPSEAIAPATQTALAGVFDVGGVKNAIQSAAQNLGRRSLGFTKGMLKKLPKGTDTANGIAQQMLDKGVIQPLSGAKETLGRAQDLASESGQQIGEGLKALDEHGLKSFNPKQIANKVYNHLKSAYSGGAYDSQNKIAQEIKDTILAHGDESVSFQNAQELKEKLQELGKFNSMSDAMKSEMYRKASSVVRQALEDSVGNAAKSAGIDMTALALPKESTAIVPSSMGIKPPLADSQILPETLSRYLEAKKTYGGAQSAIKALTDKSAGEASNSLLSLRGAAIGAGALASGHITPALEALGVWEAARRVGAATGAATLNTLNKSAVSEAARKAVLSAVVDRFVHGSNQ